MSSKNKSKHSSPDKAKSKSGLSADKHARNSLITDGATSADKLNGDPAFDKYVWREEEEFTPPPFGKDRKRLSHNFVEKKRKDKIKTWINSIGDILPHYLFKDTEKNTITTLEKTVDYLTDLKQKYSLLLQDKGSQVQAEEIARLEKHVEDSQKTINRYENILKEAGIGFTLDPGSLWKTKNHKYSIAQNVASSNLSVSGSGEAPSTSDSATSESWKGAENVTNKTAADSTSENIDTLSLKQEVKPESTKKKRVRNRSSLVSTQLKEQTNSQSQSPTILPSGGSQGNQDMLGAAMNAASIGMGAPGHSALNFAGSNQIMYAGNQLIAPHGAPVANVNQVLVPAPIAGGANQMMVPPSGMMSVMNSGLTPGIAQNGFVYMQQPGGNPIGQSSAATGEATVMTPGGNLLPMTQQNVVNKNTDEQQTISMSAPQTMTNQNSYNQNNALQTLASIATSNQGNTSVPMATTVLPQVSSSAQTSNITTVTHVLNSTAPIMSASTNQNAANTSTIQGYSSAVNMPFVQTRSNNGSVTMPQVTNQNAGIQSQGGFIIHNGQVMFVNSDTAAALAQQGGQAQVNAGTALTGASVTTTPGVSTPLGGDSTKAGQAVNVGSAANIVVNTTSSTSGTGQDVSGSHMQTANQQTLGTLNDNTAQVSLPLIGQQQTLIRPQQIVNQSQMPLYNSLQTSHLQNVVPGPQQVTSNALSGNIPITMATQTQAVGGAAVAQTTQPQGYITTVPSQPNQLPTALILPNGQIIPVVTQPNLLFQSSAPSSATAGCNNMVVTPGGQVIQHQQQGVVNNKPGSAAGIVNPNSQSFVFPSGGSSSTDMNLNNTGVQTATCQPGTLTTGTSLTTAKPQAQMFGTNSIMVTGSGAGGSTPSLQGQFMNPQGVVTNLNATVATNPMQKTATSVSLPNQLPSSVQGIGAGNVSITLPASTPSQTVHHLPQPSPAAIRPNPTAANQSAPSTGAEPSTPGVAVSSPLVSNFPMNVNTSTPGQPVLGSGTILLVDSNGVPIGTIPAGQSLPNAPPPPSATSKKSLKKSGQRVLMPKPPNFSGSHTPNFVNHTPTFTYPGLQPNIAGLQPSTNLWNTPIFTSVTDSVNSDQAPNQNKSVANSNTVTMTTKTSNSSPSTGNTSVAESKDVNEVTTDATATTQVTAKSDFVTVAVTTTTTCTAQTDILAQAAESIFSSMSEISPQIGDYCTADDENALHIDTSVGEMEETASPAQPGGKAQDKSMKSGETSEGSQQPGVNTAQNQKPCLQNGSKDAASLLGNSSHDNTHEMSELIIDTDDLEMQDKQSRPIDNNQIHSQGQTISTTTNQVTAQGQSFLTDMSQGSTANQTAPSSLLYAPQSSVSGGFSHQMAQSTQSNMAAAGGLNVMPQQEAKVSQIMTQQNSVEQQNQRLQQTMELMQGPIAPPPRHLLVQTGTTITQLPPSNQPVAVPTVAPPSVKIDEPKKKNSKNRKSSNDPNKPNKKKSNKKASALSSSATMSVMTPATTSLVSSVTTSAMTLTVTSTVTSPVTQQPIMASATSTNQSVETAPSADGRPEDFLPETITFTESELSQVLDQVESLGQSLQNTEEGQLQNNTTTTSDPATMSMVSPMQIEPPTDAANTSQTPELGQGQGHSFPELPEKEIGGKESKKSRSRKSKSSANSSDQPVAKRKKKSNDTVKEPPDAAPHIYTSQLMLDGFSAAMDGDTADVSAHLVPTDSRRAIAESDSSVQEVVTDKVEVGPSKAAMPLDDDVDKQSTSSLQMDLLLDFDSPAPVPQSSDSDPIAMETDKKELEPSSSAITPNMMDSSASPLSSSSPMQHVSSLASPVLSSPEPVLTIITGDMPPQPPTHQSPLKSSSMYPPMTAHVPISNKKIPVQSPPGKAQQNMAGLKSSSLSPGRGQHTQSAHSVHMSPPASRGLHQSLQMSPASGRTTGHGSQHSPVRAQPGMQISTANSSPKTLPPAGNPSQHQHQLHESPNKSIFDSVKSMAATTSPSQAQISCPTSTVQTLTDDSVSHNLSLLSKMAASPTMLSPPNMVVSPTSSEPIKSADAKMYNKPAVSDNLVEEKSVSRSSSSVSMLPSNPLMTSPPQGHNQGQSRRNKHRNTHHKDSMNHLEGMHKHQQQQQQQQQQLPGSKIDMPPGGQKMNQAPAHGLYPKGRGPQFPVNLTTGRDAEERDMRMVNSGLPPHLSMLSQNSHLMPSRGGYPGIPGAGEPGMGAYPSPHLNYSAQSLFSNHNHQNKNLASPHQPAGQLSMMPDANASSSSSVSSHHRHAGGATSPATIQHRSNFYLSDNLSSPHSEVRSPYGALHQKDKMMSPSSDGGLSGSRFGGQNHMPPAMAMQENYNFPNFGMSSSAVTTTTPSSSVLTSSSSMSAATTATTNAFTFSLTSATTTTASSSVSGHMPAHHHPFPFFPLHPSLAQHGHPPPPPPMHRTPAAVSSSSAASSLSAPGRASMMHEVGLNRDGVAHGDHAPPGPNQHHHTPPTLTSMQPSPRLAHQRAVAPPSGQNQNLRRGNPGERMTSPASAASSSQPPPLLTVSRNVPQPRSSSSSSSSASSYHQQQQPFSAEDAGMRGRDANPQYMDRPGLTHPPREPRHSVRETKLPAPSSGGHGVGGDARVGLQPRGSGLGVAQNTTAAQRPRSGSLPRASPHVNSDVGAFFNPPGFPSPGGGIPLNSPTPLHHSTREPISALPGAPQRNPNFDGAFTTPEFTGMTSFNAPNFEPPPLQVARTSASTSETNTFTTTTNQSSTAAIPSRTSTSKSSSKSGSKSKSSKSKKKASASNNNNNNSSNNSKQMCEVDTNLSNSIFESNRSMTPFFPIGSMSPPPTARGLQGDGPTYIPGNLFPNPSRPLSNSSTVQHKATPEMNAPPFNPLFQSSRSQSSLGLNFQPPHGFPMNHMHAANHHHTSSAAMTTPHSSSVSVTPHVPNFSLSNIFQDMNNAAGVQGDALNISPIKFHHASPMLPPHQPGMDHNALQHHHHQSAAIYHNRPHPPPPVIHNAMAINSILGHQHHGFEARGMAPGMNGGMGPPFHGHAHTPSFGLPTMNFMHDH